MLPFKRLKNAEEGWNHEDFEIFWKHYELVQEWIRIQCESRQIAWKDWEYAEKQLESSGITTLKIGQNLIIQRNENDLIADETRLLPVDGENVQNKVEEGNSLVTRNGKPKQTRAQLLDKETQGKKAEQSSSIRDSDEESLDEEMKNFIKTTIEHRKQRDAKRRLDQQQNRGKDHFHNDDYCDASNMNFTSINRDQGSGIANHQLEKRARIFRRNNLYGMDGVGKLNSLEASIHALFDSELSKHVPNTWPNIPLRF